MKIEELKNKKILILGFGREGRDTFKFLRKLFPEKVFAIADKLAFQDFDLKTKKLISQIAFGHKKRIITYFGEDYRKSIKNYEIIIKSPGIPPKEIAPFLTKKQKVTSQTEIFFENCPGKIVGITGTKGKSTTSALVYQILKEAGLKAHLVGNIGRPVLNLLFSARPEDIYVYEISSHQLYNLKKSPQIAVFLNISPEHLDYYQNFNEYLKAKANITKYQTENDYLIYNAKDRLIREIVRKSKAKKIPIPNFYKFLDKKSLRKEIPLQNIMAAVRVGKILGISEEKIKKAIENFKPLSHRLELVGNFRGITFYNDSLATVPQATIAALDTLGKKVQTIILGGLDRGVDFKNLAKRILKSQIKNIIFFPTTGKKIWQEIISLIGQKRAQRKFRSFFVDNMPGAVKLAYQYTQKGKVCLLSCAAASFNLFKDYKERGNLFKKYVRKIAKNEKFLF